MRSKHQNLILGPHLVSFQLEKSVHTNKDKPSKFGYFFTFEVRPCICNQRLRLYILFLLFAFPLASFFGFVYQVQDIIISYASLVLTIH